MAQRTLYVIYLQQFFDCLFFPDAVDIIKELIDIMVYDDRDTLKYILFNSLF